MADRSVTYRLRAEVSQFRAQMASAGASVKASANEMTAANKKSAAFRTGLLSVGKTAGLIGLGAGAALGVVVLAAANFDQAMSKVQAATHDSAAEMEQLRAAAIKAGAQTKYSASEAAEGIESLAKAGVSTKDILGGGLSGALSLAAAGNQSVGDSAETAASAMTQFKLSGSDIPHIADLLAAGAGKAQGEVSDLAAALNQAGLVASQTGLSINETTAGLSAFASAGLIGSDAGTSFKTMLLRLTPQSSQARNLMDELNLSAYDSQGSFIGLAKYAGVLHDRLKDMSDQQRNATLQTLFGQDAIRAANVLYQQGSKGIEDWTKKVNVQGYAAQTAAIKMDNLAGDLEQLRGSLETAFIGAGEGSQGPLRKLVEGATSVLNAYNRLPAAGKNASTGLLAVTAAAGTGLFVFSRVVQFAANTRLALTQLGVSAETTSAKLKLIGKGTLGIVAFVGIAEAAGTVARSFDKAAPQVDHLTKSLLALNTAANQASVASVTSQLGDLSQSLKDAEDAKTGRSDGIPVIGGLANSIADAKSAIDGMLPWMDDARASAREAAGGIDSLDQALAGMVSGGHADAAQQTFEQLASTYHLTADEQSRLKALLPQYGAALDAAGNSAKLSADKSAGLTHSLKQTGKAMQDTSAKAQAARKAAHQYAESWVSLGKSVGDAKVSLSDWIKSLQKQADALRNFRVNAQNAAKKGLDEGLIVSLNKAGPTGALRMKQLADATQSQIKAANAAWRSQSRQVDLSTEQIAGYIAGIPGLKVTNFKLNGTQTALQQARAIATAINNLHDKTIRLTTVHGTGGHSVAGDAAGGTIPGPRLPYGDKVLRWLAPGEEVISNSKGQADQHRPLLKRINSGAGMADGGTVFGAGSGASDGASGSSVSQAATQTAHALHGLKQSTDAAKKSLDDEKQHRDNLLQAQKDLSSSVAGGFRSDLFGDSSAWTGGGSAQATLKSDIAHARQFNQALHTLSRKGVHGAALAAVAQSGDLTGAQMLAAHPNNFQHLFQLRQRVTNQAGQFAGNERYGADIRAVRAEVVKLRKEVTHLRREAPHNADRTGKAAAAGTDARARRAARRKHP